MRKPLRSSFLLVFFLVMSCAALQIVKQPSSEKQQQRNFGSSLKKLKWDAKKRRAVEIDDKETKGRKDGGEIQSDDALKPETLLVTFDVAVTNALTSQPGVEKGGLRCIRRWPATSDFIF